MVGPSKKKMADRDVCSECEMVISKELGGTKKFPEKRTNYYCTNFPGNGVSFIKNYPYTPIWCPAKKI